MIEAVQHYAVHEATISSLSEVLSTVQEVEQYAAAKNLQVFWRGQSDHTWGLTSSLVRGVSRLTIPTDKLLNTIEDRILDDGMKWIAEISNPPYGEPLARLAYLQHHGIPTRLLDFTKNAWMAIFFAVESGDAVDGRLFALIVDQASALNATPAGTPWRKWKTSEVKVWDPVASGINFPRIAAQEGVFAVGRLPSTQPHRVAKDSVLGQKRSLLAEEVRGILSIPFKLCPPKPIPPNARPPIGLTFRVHIDKQSVRRDLRKEGQGRRVCPHPQAITHQQVYPDADGMRSHSDVLRGLAKGVLVV
ncbi:FRG domain-containing protein [Planctomycetales bacterium ZRK34]|nr:FRG domain-containing protein [Planctomycetales bacterium ZRK34]